MRIIKTYEDLRAYRRGLTAQRKTLVLVPTMGALHEGHLSLAKIGLEHGDEIIVSIFVNPTQFAPHEDFDSYPRTVEDDIKKLEKIGVHTVWLPSVEDIYPNGIEVDIHISGVSEALEGTFRPHFFDGVATVVARLFLGVKPEIAIFGEKDFQQLQVIKKIVDDSNFPVKIIGAPIIRDENGLALSSRNAYLSEDEYKIAIQLNKILSDIVLGEIDESAAHQKLLDAGFDKIDYCECRNAETFGTEDPNRVLAAVWLGKTRLIDNMAIKEKEIHNVT